jgi:hypothetical protein
MAKRVPNATPALRAGRPRGLLRTKQRFERARDRLARSNGAIHVRRSGRDLSR